jgi:tRNA(fMet)-specific endonuclease VapC
MFWANSSAARTFRKTPRNTSLKYGRVRAQLAQAGTPIPENDIWIAAVALEHQLPLSARDVHFEWITGLQVLKW